MPLAQQRPTDRPHPGQLGLRRRCTAAVVVLLALLLVVGATGAQQAQGQGAGLPGDGFGSPAARPPVPLPSGKPTVTSGLSEFATDELVADIQVRGNRTVPASRITGQMQTRVGRPYDPRIMAADIKKLASLPYFVTVRPLNQRTEAGRVIVLEVVERRALRYVEYLGNESIKDKKLAEVTGLTVGGAVDPYAVEEGKRKIATHYREKGFNRVHVEIIEGNKPSDQGVSYSINEGEQEKIWSVVFEGNEFASDGQLKGKIKSKPGFARLFGGKLQREQLDTDVQRITSYYRSFGFFRARVGRSVELVEDGDWATIRFAINEGPRYAIRNVTLNGVEIFEQGSVRGGLQLGPEQLFEQALMQADIGWLRDLYGSRGYIFADVKAETLFLEEPGKIDLVYNIDEGERWRVGRVLVNIRGEDAHTRLPVAMNRLSIHPGDILDTRKLRDSERRLGASTVFNTNPAQGSVPKISYQPTEETKRRFAEREKEKEEGRRGMFRGQGGPAYTGSATPPRHTSYKPPVTYAPPVGAGGDGWPSRAPHVTAKAPAPAPSDGYFRGQSPAGYPATNFSPTPKSGSSVYRVEQSNAGSPEEALFRSGTPYADPGPPANRSVGASTAPDAHYGGMAVGATDPSAVPIGGSGAPVQSLGVVEGTANSGVVPTRFSQGAGPPSIAPPTYGAYSPVQSNPPPTPVNTQLFPTQVYAPAYAPPPNDPFADIIVDLEETQTGRFMVGVAVNSDAGVVGQISLDERNFDWRRFPRSMQDLRDGSAFRGGGQRFRLEAAPGTQVQRYLASWQEPYLMDTPVSLNLSGSYFDRRFDDWTEQRLGGRVGLGYQWVDRDLSGQLTYRGESVTISNVSNSAIPEYNEVLGDNALHGFGVRLVTDKRDNPFLATEGYYLSLGLEQVLGSFTYPRAEIDARTYVLLRERPDHTGRHVLTFQNRTGFTGSNTPVYDRFYAGGFSTLRGFDFRGASPVVVNGGTAAEVGGDFQFINTLEYMFPLTADDMVNGVAFIDHGTVNEDISLDNYRVAPGLGLRITVPAMGPAPIALDFAWAVAGPETDDKRVFTFNVGFQR